MEYFELIKRYPNFFTNENAAFRIITDPKEINDWQLKRREKLLADQKPQKWADIGVVLDDPYILVIRDLVEFPGGFRGGYVRLINKADLSGGQGVVVLPIMDGKIFLLHHFRHATRSWHWEIPRGFGEENTTPEAQARAEISEEMGGEIKYVMDLGLMYNNTGIEGHAVQMYFAQLSRTGEAQTSEGIDSYQWVNVKGVEDLIRIGQIDDGFTIVAYTRAKLIGLI